MPDSFYVLVKREGEKRKKKKAGKGGDEEKMVKIKKIDLGGIIFRTFIP